MEKKVLIFGAVFVLLLYVVIALAGDGVKIISPTSGSNYTTISSTLFNVSFLNGTDITDPSNATFYINSSTGWSAIGSTLGTGGCSVSSCSVSLTNSTLLPMEFIY